MPIFEYEAVDSNQKRFKAVTEANSSEELEKVLIEKKMTVISLKEQVKRKGEINIAILNRIKSQDVVVFSRQFAVMLRASVPVVKSLKILVKQTTNPKLQAVISSVAEEVEGGIKLSQALSRHKKVFGDFFIAMIKSGETSGQLDDVLDYLADSQEKDYDLTSKIKGAMTYPIFIVCTLFAVGIVMMVFVIPKLTEVLTESGAKLPLATRILVGASDFLVNFWWLVLALIIGIVALIKYLTKGESGKLIRDSLVLKLPIFGKLFQKIYLVRFTRSLATLSSGGINLVEALKITSEIVGNKVYRDIIDQTVVEVQEGNQIASVLINAKQVPAMVAYMVSVGEQTGKLDLVLTKLSEFYAREIDNMVVNLVSLIEPLIMIVLGVAVGVMVAAIIMPMYNMASAF